MLAAWPASNQYSGVSLSTKSFDIIGKLIKKFDLLLTFKEIDSLKSLMAECADDKDMLKMANEEMDQAVEGEKRLQMLLLKSLLPKDDADERGSILEVRAGGQHPFIYIFILCRCFLRPGVLVS